MVSDEPGQRGASKAARASDAWLAPASYWTPSYLVESAWRTHAPFAFWIIDALRPRTVVELGTHNGFSYFTWCEAAERLGLDTQFTAIDSWEGDDHAGFYGEDVYRGVVEQNARYSSRSTLLRGYFSARAGEVQDGSVDLLHIDGRHGYEDVREDFELYAPKLTSRGIVMFHDIAEHREGFGVFQLWDELAARYPSFAFEHGHGLGILFVGEDSTVGFGPFIAAAKNESRAIRADYEALGESVERRYWDEQAAANQPTLEVAYQGARAEVDAMHNSHSWRVTAPLRALSTRFGRRNQST